MNEFTRFIATIFILSGLAIWFGFWQTDCVEQPKSGKVEITDPHLVLRKASEELRRNPHAAYWHQQASIAYGMLGQRSLALRELDEAIRNDPGQPGLYYDLASIKEQLGDLPGKVESLRTALVLDPNNPVGHCALGDALERSENTRASLAEYRLCIANLKYAKKDDYYDSGGTAYSIKGLRREAEAAIKRLRRGVLPKLPEKPPPKQEVTPKIRDLGFDPDELLKKASKELQRNPHAALWHRRASGAYVTLGDLESAQKEAKEAIRSDPDDTQSYYWAAYVSRQGGDLPTELELLQKALTLDPKNPLGHFRYAKALEHRGDLIEAIREYQRCLENLKYAKHADYYLDVRGAFHNTARLRREAEKRAEELQAKVEPQPKKN